MKVSEEEKGEVEILWSEALDREREGDTLGLLALCRRIVDVDPAHPADALLHALEGERMAVDEAFSRLDGLCRKLFAEGVALFEEAFSDRDLEASRLALEAMARLKEDLGPYRARLKAAVQEERLRRSIACRDWHDALDRFSRIEAWLRVEDLKALGEYESALEELRRALVEEKRKAFDDALPRSEFGACSRALADLEGLGEKVTTLQRKLGFAEKKEQLGEVLTKKDWEKANFLLGEVCPLAGDGDGDALEGMKAAVKRLQRGLTAEHQARFEAGLSKEDFSSCRRELEELERLGQEVGGQQRKLSLSQKRSRLERALGDGDWHEAGSVLAEMVAQGHAGTEGYEARLADLKKGLAGERRKAFDEALVERCYDRCRRLLRESIDLGLPREDQDRMQAALDARLRSRSWSKRSMWFIAGAVSIFLIFKVCAHYLSEYNRRLIGRVADGLEACSREKGGFDGLKADLEGSILPGLGGEVRKSPFWRLAVLMVPWDGLSTDSLLEVEGLVKNEYKRLPFTYDLIKEEVSLRLRQSFDEPVRINGSLKLSIDRRGHPVDRVEFLNENFVPEGDVVDLSGIVPGPEDGSFELRLFDPEGYCSRLSVELDQTPPRVTMTYFDRCFDDSRYSIEVNDASGGDLHELRDFRSNDPSAALCEDNPFRISVAPVRLPPGMLFKNLTWSFTAADSLGNVTPRMNGGLTVVAGRIDQAVRALHNQDWQACLEFIEEDIRIVGFCLLWQEAFGFPLDSMAFAEKGPASCEAILLGGEERPGPVHSMRTLVWIWREALEMGLMQTAATGWDKQGIAGGDLFSAAKAAYLRLQKVAGLLPCSLQGDLTARARRGSHRVRERIHCLEMGLVYDGPALTFGDGIDGPLDSYLHGASGLRFIRLPGGPYRMGSPAGMGEPEERPQVNVLIGPLLLCTTECTNAAWARIEQGGDASPVDPDLPKVEISYDDCLEWCSKTGCMRLPTEAEWEYGCACGGTGRYGFDNPEKSLADYAWYEEVQRAPVARKLPNAFGLYDMHGNVSEWCLDAWSAGPGLGGDDENAQDRVVKGGHYSACAYGVRTAVRQRAEKYERNRYRGFRPAVDLPCPED